MKKAILFSGQGAQVVGMGLDFIQKEPILLSRLKSYEQILGLDIIELLNDAEKINDTRYTQPLMVIVEMLIHDYLIDLGLKVDGYAGFSLGEFTGLYTAGFYDDKTILKLINQRAIYMQEASHKTEGLMAAILGLEDQVVENICKNISTTSDIVVSANYNSDGQLVISGSKVAVENAVVKAKEHGAKRAIILNVSGAFHSPYMKEAGSKLKNYAKDFELNQSNRDLYANSNANKLSFKDVLHEIETQIQSPVYFKQSIRQMILDGYTHFIEVGPGSVLSGLVKKIDPNVTVVSISKFEDVIKIKEII